jgi:hypothetical protein
MALTDGRYVTGAQLLAHVGITTATAAEELRLQIALDSAEDMIDDWCQRTFSVATQATSRTYATIDPFVLQVDDIGSTTSLVIVDGSDTLASGDYQLEPLNADKRGRPWTQIRRLGTTWDIPANAGQGTITVTARHGWPAIPDQIKRAALAAAGWLFTGATAPLGVAGVNEFGPMRLSAMAPLVVPLLSDYRRGDRSFGLA